MIFIHIKYFLVITILRNLSQYKRYSQLLGTILLLLLLFTIYFSLQNIITYILYLVIMMCNSQAAGIFFQKSYKLYKFAKY